MDLQFINTKADAERGALLHYVHPQLGHPLYTGDGANRIGELVDASRPHEAVTALLRGEESSHVRAVANRLSKEKMRGKSDEDVGFEYVHSFFLAINGVTRDGVPLTTSMDDIKYFFERSDDFSTQTLRFVREKSNFFDPASRD